MSDEQPQIVYGRLLESVHISGYTAERACIGLEHLLENDRWKSVGIGFERIDDFYMSITLAQFKVAVDRRKKLVKRMAEIQGATQRAIGHVVGVHHSTVQADLGGNPPKQVRKPAVEADPGGNPPSSLTALSTSGPQVGQLVEQKAKREAKDREREEKRQANQDLVSRAEPFPADAVAATTVIDPPWDWGDEGDVSQFGRGDPTYHTISFDELLEIPVGTSTAKDAHLYLWITNRSLPKGFTLIERWGFRYVTCLTWCKPSIGMGNYFRGSTEHCLFCIRGSLPLLRKDVGTWFQLPRGNEHSEKPSGFYELVESCSPGPWRDIFARQQRPGWLPAWGAEIAS